MIENDHRIGPDGFQFLASHFKSATCYTDGRLVIETIDKPLKELQFAPVHKGAPAEDAPMSVLDRLEVLEIMLAQQNIHFQKEIPDAADDGVYCRLSMPRP